MTPVYAIHRDHIGDDLMTHTGSSRICLKSCLSRTMQVHRQLPKRKAGLDRSSSLQTPDKKIGGENSSHIDIELSIWRKIGVDLGAMLIK